MMEPINQELGMCRFCQRPLSHMVSNNEISLYCLRHREGQFLVRTLRGFRLYFLDYDGSPNSRFLVDLPSIDLGIYDALALCGFSIWYLQTKKSDRTRKYL